MITATLSTILGNISAILVACDPPDVLNRSATAFQRDALNSNPTFVFCSGNPQVSHVCVKEPGDVRESVVCIAICFL